MVSRRQRFGVFLLVLALVLGAGLRLVHLDADPPQSLSRSRSIFNDGGAYALNARYRLLSGSWIAPGDNVIAQAPGFTLLAYAAFRTLGLGVSSLRALSVAGTLAAVAALCFLAYRRPGLPAAILTAVLLGTDYLFVMYGRLELLEGLLSGIAALSVAAAVTAVERQGPSSAAWAALSGVLYVAAVLVKPTAFLVAAPLLVCLAPVEAWPRWLRWRPRRPPGVDAGPRSTAGGSRGPGVARGFVPLAVLLLTTAALLALYVVLFYLPEHTLFERFQRSFAENASSLWDWRAPVVTFQALTLPGLWGLRGVPLLALAVIGLLSVWEERDAAGRALATWFLVEAAYLAPQSYRPSRFSVLMIPPAAALAARGAAWLWHNGRRLNPVAAAGWTAYAISTTMLTLRYPIRLLTAPDRELAAAFLLVSAASCLARRWKPAPQVAGPLIAMALCATAIGFSLDGWARWAASPTYSLERSGRALGKLLSGQPSAGDNWCESLALMHRAPAYKIDWLPVSERGLKQWRVKYLVYDASETRVPELYSRILRRSHRRMRLRVGHYRVNVDEITW